MKKQKIDVVFLLDRSGSMANCVLDTIGGYNSYLKQQRESGNDIKVSTILFDNKYEILHDREDILKVKDITDEEYYVRGTTALYDAIGKTIEHIDDLYLKNKVLFIITTDGLENASIRYDRNKIKEMIQGHENIEFIYIGANIDSYAEASSIGISRKNTANYETNKMGVERLFKSVAKATDSVCFNEPICCDWKDDLMSYDK